MRLPLRVLADSQPWTLSSWLVTPGASVYRNQRVATLLSPSTGATDHALAPRRGTLTATHVAVSAVVNPPSFANPAIATLEYCPHVVVFHGLCGVCGEDASAVHFAETPAATASASARRLPVAYNAGMSITRGEAETVASAATRQLLAARRLLLVLDLDHTLVHATDDPRAAAALLHSPPGSEKESIAGFELGPPAAGPVGCQDSRMHLKLRPHLAQFLARCARKFELHIYTMGSRPYADQVARLIDPDKRLFSGRITSREDFEEGRSNQKNISRLFPCDDSMVLIVDDREDVWVSGTGASFMPNLIRAKPYTFWNGLHEAYDRALASGPSSGVDGGTEDMTDAVSDLPVFEGNGDGKGDAATADRTDTKAKRDGEDGHNVHSGEVVDSSSNAAARAGTVGKGQLKAVCQGSPQVTITAPSASPDDDAAGAAGDPMPVLTEELRKLVCQWWENDTATQGWNDHLLRLADVLETCHARFFEHSPQPRDDEATAGSCPTENSSALKIPADVKVVLGGIRSKVLAGCFLTFTGVIPLNVRLEDSFLWELATRHGAVCHKEFIPGETTHVVASVKRGLQTEKTRAAVSSGAAFVVDLLWLEDSTIQFERRPELLYGFSDANPSAREWSVHRANVEEIYHRVRGERIASEVITSQNGNIGTRDDSTLQSMNGHGTFSPPGSRDPSLAESGAAAAVSIVRTATMECGDRPRKVRRVGSELKKDSGSQQRELDPAEVDDALEDMFG